MIARRWIFVLALAACSPAKGTPSPPPTSTGAAATTTPTVAPATDAGEGTEPDVTASTTPTCDKPVLVVAPRIDVKCWPQQPCKASYEFAIDNCTDNPISVFWLLDSASPETNGNKKTSTDPIELDPMPVVTAHTRRTFRWPPAGVRELALGQRVLRVAIHLGATDAGGLYLLDAPLELFDSAMDKAQADCVASGDDWGVHGGFAAELGCAKVMKDAGKECHDERDCEGFCFLEKSVKVSKTEKLVSGHCTRFKSRIGCHTVIGKTNNGLIPLNSNFVNQCVD
jgi:hypothetical protein